MDEALGLLDYALHLWEIVLFVRTRFNCNHSRFEIYDCITKL